MMHVRQYRESSVLIPLLLMASLCCTPWCCEALHVSLPSQPQQHHRLVPPTSTPPAAAQLVSDYRLRYHRLQMSYNYYDNYEQYTTSDDEPFDNTHQHQHKHQYDNTHQHNNNQYGYNRRQQPNFDNKLPLEDLLSDKRRQELKSNLSALTQGADERYERMSHKLMELGRGRGHRQNAYDSANQAQNQVMHNTGGTNSMNNSITNSERSKVNFNDRFTGVVPTAAASVASLSGLAFFRDNMIKRQQKEAEVRRDRMDRAQRRQQIADERRRRASSAGMRGMISGAAASLGAFAVSASAQASAMTPEKFDLREEQSNTATSSIVRGAQRQQNHLNNVSPIGFGNAYALDTTNQLLASEDGVESATQIFSGGFSDAKSKGSKGGTTGGDDYYVQLDVPTRNSDGSSGVIGKSNQPPGAATKPGGDSSSLYVQMDVPSNRMASQSPPKSEPEVRFDEPIRKAIPQRLPAPVPPVQKIVMEDTGPARRMQPSSSDVRVVMEQSPSAIPQRLPALVPPVQKIVMEDIGPARRMQPSSSDVRVVMEQSPSRKVMPRPRREDEMKVKYVQTIPTRINPFPTPPTPTSQPNIRKRRAVESIRPEALEYIRGYNNAQGSPVQQKQQRPQNLAATSAPPPTKDQLKATTPEPKITSYPKPSKQNNEPPAPASTTISGVMSTAKTFSIGVAAGTVIVVTQQKKDKSSPGVSTTGTAAYENANDVESINGSRNRNPNHSYLDSISVVSSAGQGRQSYLDELSESSPLTFDDNNGDSSYATTWPEMTQSVDENAESHHFSLSIGESAAAGLSGASYLESMNGKQPSMAPETATPRSTQHSLQNGETQADMPRLSYLESLSAGTSAMVSQDYGQSYLNSL